MKEAVPGTGSVVKIDVPENARLAEIRLVVKGTELYLSATLNREQVRDLIEALERTEKALPYTERQTKRRELIERLSAESRRISYHTQIDLGWQCAMRKLKKLGKPLPTRINTDWHCKPFSAPAAASGSQPGIHVYAGACWTGEWNVWGIDDGRHWDYSGKVRRSAYEKEYGKRLAARRAEIAKELGLEELSRD